METTGPGSATVLAAAVAADGWPRLVVAGGDGTINEAVNGLAGTDTELAIIPTGTANVLAIELGVPRDISKACHIAATGQCIEIDLGKAGDRYFTLMAGAGFDALVIKNLNLKLKRAIRRAAYPIAGMKTFLGQELPPLQVIADDKQVEGYFIVAANSRYYGGHFGPTPTASMTDGRLDICVLKEKSFLKMIDFWYRALKTDTADSSNVEYFRAEAVDVATDSGTPVLVQVDGEVFGELPMRFSVEPRSLKVCIGAGR
jgi:YegS/Rv2252/BmrU family lipid kinase